MTFNIQQYGNLASTMLAKLQYCYYCVTLINPYLIGWIRPRNRKCLFRSIDVIEVQTMIIDIHSQQLHNES